MIRRTTSYLALISLTAAFVLSGCLTGGSTEEVSGQQSPPLPPSGNSAPTISGSPQGMVLVGDGYSFTPVASDQDGDTLTFTIQNLPRWAQFNSNSGALTGTPNMGDAGLYNNIVISVSDGSAEVSLPQFTINVTQTATGSATLSWNAPTQNSDGSPLSNLAGYRIYYGNTQGSFPNQVQVDNPGVTTFVVENLTPDTYYFVSTAVNSSGAESQYSNVATKIVN